MARLLADLHWRSCQFHHRLKGNTMNLAHIFNVSIPRSLAAK